MLLVDANDDVEPTKKRARTDPCATSRITTEAVMDRSVVTPVTTPSVDAEIKERIRNILQRGLHPNTPEAEAANSIRLAERMLRKHNVSRSEIMMHAEDASVNGDLVRVHIRNRHTEMPGTTTQWFQDLSKALTKHFRCKYYYNFRMGQRCFFAFYGIASNVYAAALAFEVAFNRVMVLVSRHTVPREEYDRKRRVGEISVCRATYTRSARASYCDGVVMGLLQGVRDIARTPSQTTPEELEYTVTAEEETRLACVTKKVEESVLKTNEVTIKREKQRCTFVHCRA